MSNRGFRITASSSDDVVGYRVTLLQGGTVVATKDFADDERIAVPGEPSKREFELADDPAFPNLDGTYDVEVRAIDDAGNTSGPLAGVLTLDFVAPEAPADFEAF